MSGGDGPGGRPKGRAWEALKAQVYREESICWLCGEPVDVRLRGRTRWSRSVDHVRPWCDYPHLALVRSNLRLAHYGCNAARRARGDVAPAMERSREW